MLKYPNLKDHIFEYDLLSDQECDQIVSLLDSREWGEFSWYQDFEQVDIDKESNMKSTVTAPEAVNIIQPHINDELFNAFHEKYNYYDVEDNQTGGSFWEACSGIKFNKYDVGDYLSPHYDHIRDFFEGQFRGIPVTSVVGVLNDDFEGGEFRFWKEHTVNIKKGSVLVFPALYLFPHEVMPVTKGTRYSWIQWIV
jgi:predicted 2-oxoglutarate/Fe(II)-dependent dioxygenase YbiX|tara:strand:+ start:21092 stop:21679 length:588 start_codon:yes stop_codon:yes gene_type:complete